MIKRTPLSSRLALAALLAATMIPASAFAGEQTRAEAAIAEAKGKIDAGDKVGANDQAPALQSQARAALMSAQDMLAHHQKSEAIAEAHRASGLADQAIVTANTRKAENERSRRDDLRDAGARAQQTAATANNRAGAAEAATDNANLRADNANQRAENAERSTAAANAQIEAMRAAPPPPPAPMPTTTTVAISSHDVVDSDRAPVRHTVRKARARAGHRVMHRTVHHHHVKTTTVTTTTHP
ncbi:hypothetical protein [Novosphingobium sp.]|uniref:hypothetical protein n=1 Tax=Novosphingobium sp. TaxID=1874826 RepID=UPI00333EABC7